MSAVQGQLALATPTDHAVELHPGDRKGTVLIWRQNDSAGRSWIKIQPAAVLSDAANAEIGAPDRYITVNQFHGWRRVDCLSRLCAVYVDLDPKEGCSPPPRTVDGVLALCSDLALPIPGLVVFSGRGTHLYWLLDDTHRKALPVWQHLQDNVVLKFKPWGADPAAKDCTRVLRLVGTINSRNSATVLGYRLSPQRWSLHELADYILGPRSTKKPSTTIAPRSTATITTLEKARSARRGVPAVGTYRLWHDRYLDLCTIAEHHAFQAGGVPEGHRDTLLFLIANALSWFTLSDSLDREIERIARTLVPTLSEAEVSAYVAPIIERAREAAAGGLRSWDGDGQMHDPRYRFRTETILSWLGALVEPVSDKMRVLLPAETRKAQRLAKLNARSKDRNTGDGVRASQNAKRSEARTLRASGLSIRAVSTQLGLPRSTVERWCKGYANPAEGCPDFAPV